MTTDIVVNSYLYLYGLEKWSFAQTLRERDTFRDMQLCASDVTACTHTSACSKVHPAWRPIYALIFIKYVASI